MTKTRPPKEQELIEANDYVASLNKLAKLNQEMISIADSMVGASVSLATNEKIDTLFKERAKKLATIFQVMAVESIRSQSDIEVGLNELKSLQGRYLKP